MIEGWQVSNFLTVFILVLLYIFSRRGSRVKTGRMFNNILLTALALTVADTLARIGENRGGSFILVAYLGDLVMFLLDPLVILFSVIYIDCWMDEKNKRPREIFKIVFQAFASLNIVLVLVDQIFKLRWFFYFERGNYFRGSIFIYRAVLLALFMLLIMVYLVIFRKNVLRDYRRTLYVLPMFALLGTIIQVFDIGMNTTYLAGTLACLVLFVSFQSNDVNIDNLTGLLNRRGFDIRLQELIKTSSSKDTGFGAVMLNIDNFGKINDSFGHEEGDGAIMVFADMLIDGFGEDALIGRIDGVKFCVLTKNTSEPKIKEGIRVVKKSLESVRRKCGWSEDVGVRCVYDMYDPTTNMNAAEYRKHLEELMNNDKPQKEI